MHYSCNSLDTWSSGSDTYIAREKAIWEHNRKVALNMLIWSYSAAYTQTWWYSKAWDIGEIERQEIDSRGRETEDTIGEVGDWFDKLANDSCWYKRNRTNTLRWTTHAQWIIYDWVCTNAWQFRVQRTQDPFIPSSDGYISSRHCVENTCVYANDSNIRRVQRWDDILYLHRQRSALQVHPFVHEGGLRSREVWCCIMNWTVHGG